MPTQNVNLPQHQADFVRKLQEDGRYKNASEVVRAGLRLLEREEETYRAKLELLRAQVQEGLDDIEAGRYTDLTSDEEFDAFFDDVTKRGLELLAREENASNPNQ